MKVEIQGRGPLGIGPRARVVEAEDCGSLSALLVTTSSEDLAVAAGLVTSRAPDHVWFSVTALRELAEASLTESTDTHQWREEFNRMVAYADRMGWVSDGGAAVRAHVEIEG